MTMEIRVDRKSKEVLIMPQKHAKIIPKRIFLALADIGSDVVDEVRSLIKSSNKTGRIYTVKGVRHQASAPGEAPANRTGKLAKSANYKVRNAQEMSVGESEEYAVYLEKTRPHLITAINNRAGITYITLERALQGL